MTDDAKQAAWRRFCEQLEALGVDPYSPEVPEDDPRHGQVQAIIAEYRGIPQPLFPLPESWEGSPPLFTITSLDDVARWLRDEWSIVTATRLGSEDGVFQAKKRAAQAIRNTHRILDALKIEDRPERQPPTESLEECEEQVQRLEQWFREKHASGWKPTKAVVASPRPNRNKRSEIPDDDEINLLIKRALKANPKASIRVVAKEVGVSTGKISGMEAWQEEMAKRATDKAFSMKPERQLTDEMLAVVGTDDSPVSQAAENEAVWNWLLRTTKDKGKREEYQRLMRLDRDEQAKMIELVRPQYKEAMGKDAD